MVDCVPGDYIPLLDRRVYTWFGGRFVRVRDVAYGGALVEFALGYARGSEFADDTWECEYSGNDYAASEDEQCGIDTEEQDRVP